MNLDCRKEENKEIIQKVLRKIKPLSKYSVDECIPISALEKAITVMTKKYNMHIREFVLDTQSNAKNGIWRVVIINDNDLSILEVIYGITLYEAFAKRDHETVLPLRIYASKSNSNTLFLSKAAELYSTLPFVAQII